MVITFDTYDSSEKKKFTEMVSSRTDNNWIKTIRNRWTMSYQRHFKH